VSEATPSFGRLWPGMTTQPNIIRYSKSLKRQSGVLLGQRCLRMFGGAQVIELVEAQLLLERLLVGEPMQQVVINQDMRAAPHTRRSAVSE